MEKMRIVHFIGFLAVACLSSCHQGVSEKELLGKWNETVLKVSTDLGESWEEFHARGEWIELLPDGEFRMTDPTPIGDYDPPVEGEWHVANDSLFYYVPSRSAMGGQLEAKIIKCDKNRLILQTTDRNGYIGKLYYSRE